MLREEILRQGPETVLAFIIEPVGGASTGALVAPDSYYPEIRAICDEFGILLICDEVMSGAGRTGRYLASEHWGLRPDLVALSKGFGAGYMPLGAMVADSSIAETVIDAGGFIHGHTYAGNPLACAAGLAVLEEIDRLDLITAAARQGNALKGRLETLMQRFPFIGDVRGKGLLLAFELVADRETMEPLPVALNAHLRLVDIAYDESLIIYSRRTRGGRIGDHFMVCPPLIDLFRARPRHHGQDVLPALHRSGHRYGNRASRASPLDRDRRTGAAGRRRRSGPLHEPRHAGRTRLSGA